MLQQKGKTDLFKKSNCSKLEVINMAWHYENPGNDFVKDLFYSQIRKATKKACANESFDIQFSDSWT